MWTYLKILLLHNDDNDDDNNYQCTMQKTWLFIYSKIVNLHAIS